MLALRVENLCKALGGLTILNNLSLSVEQGERHAIVGPNGAGKTTLFNIISGFTKADQGRIFLFGRDLSDLPAYMRAREGIARTFQKNNLFFGATVQDNIRLALKSGRTPAEYVSFTEAVLQDKQHLRISQLSYGEQRQIELLLALMQSPRLLLLDEPTAGMSAAETQAISDMIKNLPDGLTLLIIEHDLDFIYNLCDRITILHHGESIVEGNVEEIKNNAMTAEIYLGKNAGGSTVCSD